MIFDLDRLALKFRSRRILKNYLGTIIACIPDVQVWFFHIPMMKKCLWSSQITGLLYTLGVSCKNSLRMNQTLLKVTPNY